MAQQIWLLRHGEAEAKDARPDAERRLTARGEHQSRAAGRALAALGLEFALVATSPKVRALDTARLAGDALGLEPVVEDGLAERFDPGVAQALAAAAGADGRILLVGHNPDFEQVVHDLTGARVDFKKGGVAGIRMTGTGRGELIALLRPREIDGLADGEVPGVASSAGTPAEDAGG